MTSQLLLLLPPSETKSDGGSRVSTNIQPDDPQLRAIGEKVRDDLIALSSGDAELAAKALKISARQAEKELARNRQLRDAEVKPAAQRYTGVLYDALDAGSLDDAARQWLDSHVLIQSALYGPVSAGSAIAAYRLSYNSKLPGASLRERWSEAVTAYLSEHQGPILDLRSKGYVTLGPLPEDRDDAVWADVVEALPNGEFRSLNHFNKRAKGLLVRKLAERHDRITSLEELREALEPEFVIEPMAAQQVRVVVRPN